MTPKEQAVTVAMIRMGIMSACVLAYAIGEAQRRAWSEGDRD